MNYAVIGTGAIGGYFGGRLAHVGKEIHFLAHSDYNEMKEALIVDSCNGSFVIEHPNVYSTTKDMPKVDVVIVALKTMKNHLLPTLLTPILKPETIVILIQNGLCVEEDLAQTMPDVQFVAGIAFIASTKVGPAHIVHQDLGSLTLGNYNCRDSQRLEVIMRDFSEAEVEIGSDDCALLRWRKAVWNLPFNGLSVAKNADTSMLVNDAENLALVRSIMKEVLSIAHALGVTQLTEDYMDKMVEMTIGMKPYFPSMKVDYDHGREMEVYYLYTRPIMEANRLGIPCPTLKKLEKNLLEMTQKG